MNLNRAFEIDDGIIGNNTVVPESLVFSAQSSRPFYTDDRLTQVIFYRSNTQTTANRVALCALTYDSEDRVTQIVTTYYEDNGSTVFQTLTTTISYNGFNVSNVEYITT